MNRWNLITISTENNKKKFKSKKRHVEYSIRDISTLPKAYHTDEEYEQNILKIPPEKREVISEPSNISSTNSFLNEFLDEDFELDNFGDELSAQEEQKDLYLQGNIYQTFKQKHQRNLTLQQDIKPKKKSEAQKRLERNQQIEKQESLERSKWEKKIDEMLPSLPHKSKLYFLEDLINFSKELIQISTSTMDNRFSLAITGPRFSGKTLFLIIFMKSLIKQFKESGKWKTNFIYFLDFSLIIDFLTHPFSLFNYIVFHSLQQISSQKPQMNLNIPRLCRYFHDAALGLTSITIPSAFSLYFSQYPNAPKIFQSISAKIFNFLNTISFHFKGQNNSQIKWEKQPINHANEEFNLTKRNEIKSFYEYLFSLPQLIASAFGFSFTQYVYDHFDEADLQLGSFLIIEAIKVTMISSSFIISCRNVKNLMDILQGSYYNSDICPLIRICSMTEIPLSQPNKQHGNESLIFETTKGEIVLGKDSCSGCPNFLGKWDYLVKLLDSIEYQERHAKAQNVTLKPNEASALLIDRANELLSMLLSDAGTVISLHKSY